MYVCLHGESESLRVRVYDHCTHAYHFFLAPSAWCDSRAAKGAQPIAQAWRLLILPRSMLSAALWAA